MPVTSIMQLLHAFFSARGNIVRIDSCTDDSIRISLTVAIRLIGAPVNRYTPSLGLKLSLRPGLGFSRPKPVFPVQNGINWDKPVFPSFSRPKLGKTVQNYVELYFKLQKSFQKSVSNKNVTGQTRSSFHNTVVMTKSNEVKFLPYFSIWWCSWFWPFLITQ